MAHLDGGSRGEKCKREERDDCWNLEKEMVL